MSFSLTFCYKSGRRGRLESAVSGPTEFFYGLPQLRTIGFDVAILEDSDLGMAPPLPTVARILNKASLFFGNLPLGMALSLLVKRGYRKFAGSGCIVVTTNGMGMALAIAKALGRIEAPVLLIAMGLLPLRPSSLQVILFKYFAKYLHIACISREEQIFLQELLPEQDVKYIPFGVDINFWSPFDLHEGKRDYVLAIGNDRYRDWTTLVKSWDPNLPTLKIVTSLPISHNLPNIEVIRGDWRTNVIDDDAIRKLYQGASCVMVPLRDTIQPSGQSVCLQAMACGRPVVLSDIAGLWDRRLLRNGENVLLVRPGSNSDLRQAAKLLCEDQELNHRIGAGGRRLVLEHFNVVSMANALALLTKEIRIS